MLLTLMCTTNCALNSLSQGSEQNYNGTLFNQFILTVFLVYLAHVHVIMIVGVDDPETSQVETSMQLPTSSSNAEKQSMSLTEDTPGMYTT